MGKLVFGLILFVAGLVLFAISRSPNAQKGATVLRTVGSLVWALALLFALGSVIVVIDAGEVGVQHAFGRVSPAPLLPGIRLVPPWSQVERYSTREEQYPEAGTEVEEIAALSRDQMGMTIDVALRWQINPTDAPRIFTEIGNEEQIHQVVGNAIRNGVRDGMVMFGIDDIAQRNRVAATMEAEVDTALVTRPRGGGEPFRIATVTAFFLRDLQPPQQVVAAINAKIAQEQQIATERHRVEVARLQAEQQRLLNQTLTPEALTKQYLEVLHEMRNSNNVVIMVPTEGGLPVLDLGQLRRNLRPAP
jgi:regulator of protease activity HflC (stomatin/prohibitin superfamily)